MIIFDLDGTLADCEHRRHFVEPVKNTEYSFRCNPRGQENMKELSGWYHLDTNKKFKPDWHAFYEACDKDTPIQPVIDIFNKFEVQLALNRCEIQIWSGRCESVRDKTLSWLEKYNIFGFSELKMRPIGDSTPDDVLKEKWLEETYEETKWGRKSSIEYVFDDRPKVVRMYRTRGIFVFDVNQSGKEF